MIPPFEPTCMAELWGLPPDEIFIEVIALVRTEIPALCANAAASLAAGRRGDLQREAHTMKGVAGNVCATRLAALAAALSDGALSAAAPALAAQLADVQEEWQRVAAVIDAGGPYG